MIIECEKCKSKFNLDESLLKEEGSKVRCSLCKHVFTAYPPDSALLEESALDEAPHEEHEETVPLDSPPLFDEQEPEAIAEGEGVDLDRALEDAAKEEPVHAVSPDEIPETEEERMDMEEAIDEVAKIEEEVPTEEIEKKIGEKPEEDVEKAAEVAAEKKPRRSRPLIIILLILLLCMSGFVAVYVWAPNLLPDSLSFLKPTEKQEVADIGVRGLSIKERSLSGEFVQSNVAGSLFVIKGTVVNGYPKSRSFILIKGTILDSKGKVIKSKRAYAGNTFSEDQIQSMSVEEINKGLRNRFGKGRMNFNIEPGGALPFMIVFEDLPENPDVMSEYTVEPVSSSPGS
jgi:predicted Zn finger-like uncharacterized protein